MVTIDRTNQDLKINLLSQIFRTLERHNPSRRQHYPLTGYWISALSFMLFLDTEFAETADKNILARCKFGFDNIGEGLDDLC